MVEVGRVLADSTLIKGIIERDRNSNKKKEMVEGVNYYEAKQDILNYDFRKFKIENATYTDSDAANNRVQMPLHSLLVDQKANYIANKDVTYTVNGSEADTKLKKLERSLNKNLNYYFAPTLNDWIIGASNKGIEWLHPYINSNGEFDYTIIPAEQIIPDYDNGYKSRLLSLMRYYPVDYQTSNGELKTKTRVEIWTKTEVTYYLENPESKNFYFEKIEPHFYETDSNNAVMGIPADWGKLPFIALKNNTEEINDLRKIKTLLDVYDKIISSGANSIEDIQEAIWVLKNYDGQDLAEFRKALKIFKAIQTTGDEGGAEPKTIDIPFEARKELLTILRKAIFVIGQGIDLSDESFYTSLSGVAIRARYAAGLDLKANKIIANIKFALKDFLFFYVWYLNYTERTDYDYEAISYEINKSIIVDETELIQNLAMSPEMSEIAKMRKHPYINDVEQNIKELKEEKGQSVSFNE